MKMKISLVLLGLLAQISVFSQWTYKTISNGFDEPFKKAYTVTNNGGWLAMQEGTLQEVVEYPDSITKKMNQILDLLAIGDRIDFIPVVKTQIIAYSTPSAYTNRLSDSSMNITGEYIVSMLVYKVPNYDLLSYEQRQKVPTYQIVTTAGAFYIGEAEYYATGFPRLHEVQYLGSQWGAKNLAAIKSLKNYRDNFAVTKTQKFPIMYLRGSYFCDDIVSVDFILTVSGVDKKYQIEGLKSSNNETLFFDDNIFTDKAFRVDFLASSKVKIRVNESYCTTEYYTFLMGSSTAAYNFINK